MNYNEHYFKRNKGHDNDPYIENKNEVALANAYLLKRIAFVCCLNMLVLSLISPFLSGFSKAEYLYVTSAVLTGLLALYSFKRLDRHLNAVTPLFYCLLAGLCAYGIALSCFFYPNIHGVTIIGIIVLAPVLILDKTRRVNLFFISLFAISCVFTFTQKPFSLAIDDVTTIGAFMVFGMLIGIYLRKNRLNAILLQHQTETQRDFDALTGLPNRRLLFETLGDSESGAASEIGGMFMIDIDDFKSYNDRYGHQAGDECLRRIGAFFCAFSEMHNVTIFRYGGEEFLGLWYQSANNELGVVTQRLVDEVQTNKNTENSITISVGYALRQADVSIENLITMADNALYEAKNHGKCRTEAYSPRMDISPERPTSFRQRT